MKPAINWVISTLMSQNWKSVLNLGIGKDSSFSSNRWLGSCSIKSMKVIVGKIRRSSVYYLMTKAGPVNEVRSAKFDTWGTVVVLVLLLVVVGLVRLFLTA
jgi:hypothetical protein